MKNRWRDKNEQISNNGQVNKQVNLAEVASMKKKKEGVESRILTTETGVKRRKGGKGRLAGATM